MTFSVSGCGDFELPEVETRPRFVLALIDETGSFDYWEEMRESVQMLVGNIQPEESFGLIGIDESGFDDDDVRFPISQLDTNTLRAVMQRRKWAQEIGQLERRREPPRTDIYGALNHAAHFMNRKQEEGYEPVLVLFTDMIHTSRTRDDNFKFNDSPEAHFFYVNASGVSRWDALMEHWIPTLQQTGLDITENDFFQRAETEDIIKKRFPKMSH